MNTRQIDRLIFTNAQASLNSLISKRDRLVAHIHHPFTPVAVWRTFKHNRALTDLNRMIESAQDYVQGLADDLDLSDDWGATDEYPARNTLELAAPVISARARGLLDWLTDNNATVHGTVDGVTVTSARGEGFKVNVRADLDGLSLYNRTNTFDSVRLDHHALAEIAKGVECELVISHPRHMTVRVRSNDKGVVVTENYWHVATA